MAALRHTLLAIVRDAAEPLPEIREIFAENRIVAIAVARKAFLKWPWADRAGGRGHGAARPIARIDLAPRPI